MSHYHHFCLAFSDLSGEVYTSSGAIVLNLTNGADGDRTVLTLSPMQTLVLSKGLRNIVKGFVWRTLTMGISRVA